MKYLIGLDLGTTAVKIGLFDSEGQTVGVSTHEYNLITLEVDYVEEDVNVYWKAFTDGILELKRSFPSELSNSVAFGISAQGETLVCVDDSGTSLRNAIVWMDNRASLEADELRDKFTDELCYEVTGQVSFEPVWPAAKILWLRNNEPETFNITKKFLLIEDYFLYKLTGKWATKGSLVTSSTYWDITNKVYWADMLDFLGINENQLAPVYESGEPLGVILSDVAEELGLFKELVVCTGALDQAAGVIGVGNIKEGMFSENIGSALAICVPVNKPVFDPNRRLPLHYFAIPNMYMLHTFTTGGMAFRWFRDKFCELEIAVGKSTDIDPYDLMGAEASLVEAGSEGLVFLPHLNGSLTPDVNSNAKGVFFGITLKHSRAHFIRATMESLGYVIKRNLEALSDMGIDVDEIRCLGGGSKNSVWNQIKADILGKKLVTTNASEAACLGAAVLAGKGVGMFTSLEDAVIKMAQIKKAYNPNSKNAQVYAKGYEIYKTVFHDLEKAFEIK
jgi:sugar (pentulose or hexulose) kinase